MEFDCDSDEEALPNTSYLAAAAKGNAIEHWLKSHEAPDEEIRREQILILDLLEDAATDTKYGSKQLQHSRFKSLRDKPRFQRLIWAIQN